MEGNKMEKLIKKIKLTYTLRLLTGLHVGDSSENVEIGGIDSPVIKLPNGEPYIPGSSLKGKIRCLLEQARGVKLCGNSEINEMFGNADKDNDKPQPSKVIFRDAYLKEESVEKFKKCSNMDMPFTEQKSENVIDRVKGKAEHPRQIERVPKGAEFRVEIVLNIWNNDKEEDLLNILEKGINLLENDYLGGSGSRGYGQVEIELVKKEYLSEQNGWKATKTE
jgi:CRISPR-associated protein Csm3